MPSTAAIWRQQFAHLLPDMQEDSRKQDKTKEKEDQGTKGQMHKNSP